jgi:hypothetical protein
MPFSPSDPECPGLSGIQNNIHSNNLSGSAGGTLFWHWWPLDEHGFEEHGDHLNFSHYLKFVIPKGVSEPAFSSAGE